MSSRDFEFLTLRFCRCFAFVKQNALYDLLYAALQTSAWHMWQIWFLFFWFYLLLSCCRGMLAESSKHYFFPGSFWGCSRIGVQKCPLPPAPRKSVTYILQWWNLGRLYLTQRRFKTYINHVTHPLGFADITIFSQKISNFCYIKKYRYRLHFNK